MTGVVRGAQTGARTVCQEGWCQQGARPSPFDIGQFSKVVCLREMPECRHIGDTEQVRRATQSGRPAAVTRHPASVFTLVSQEEMVGGPE